MLTVRSFINNRTRSWYRILLLLLSCFLFYCVWALIVFDDENSFHHGETKIELDKALSIGILIAASCLAFGSRQYLAQKKEVRRRILAEQRARRLTYYDGATNLPNRRSFEDHLDATLAAHRSQGTTHAVFVLEIGGFKQVSDIYGQQVGDRLLRAITDRLVKSARSADMVARLENDEFALLARNIPSIEEAYKAARSTAAKLAEPFKIDGMQHSISVDIGIALTSANLAAADDLLRKAEIALQRAKGEIGNGCRHYEDGMHQQLLARQSVKIELEQALKEDELRLFYQPLLDLRANEIRCCEALLRWQHPKRGLLPPGEFIEVAEESGLIVRIGEWALTQACRDAARWPSDITVAVNVSPVQFRDHALPGVIAKAIGDTGLDASRLMVEITESLLLQESETNLQLLREIKGMGVAIALDDFGTGYSSLSYLRSFPFDKVKIDRSFVKSIGISRNSEAIIRAICGLLKSLGMTVTAEGVETDDQLKWLRGVGCNEAQGYLLGRPAPVKDLSFRYRAAP